MTHSRIFRTRWGWMGLGATPRGITHIVLPRATRAAVAAELARGAHARNGRPRPRKAAPKGRRAGGGARLLDHARRELLRFFEGKARRLDFPLDLTASSPFQRRVWLAAQRIPYGRARSYAWIAARVGGRRYARAVGHALGANPLPVVVPCHRVVGHDGSLRGFAGGLHLKRWLLDLEGTLKQLTR